MIIRSSTKRMAAIAKHPPVKCCQDVLNVLSDQTGNEFRVYQEIDINDHIKTIATGMFCILNKLALRCLNVIYIVCVCFIVTSSV